MSTFAIILSRAGRWLLQLARGPQVAESTNGASTDPDFMDEHSRQVLWLRQLYAGLVGFIGGGGAALYYVFRTWEIGPHRLWIALVAVFMIGQALVVWFGRGYFVTSAQRESLFIGGILISYVVIAAASALDGGIESPIALIWVLPTIFLLMGFSRAAILVCGSIAVGLYLLVAWLTPGSLNFAAFTMQLVVLASAVFMVLLGAVAREEREGVLTAVRNQLAVLATIDSLTGCINQQAFTHIAATEVARAARYQHDISMLALDVDHFKSVNDEHGHLMGDEVLRQLGVALRASVRGTDIVARVGGDELLVLCPETDVDAAIELAERLRSTAQQLQIPFKVTLSVGVCALRPKTPDPQQLREYADRALYEAKRQGRDRYAVFAPANGRTELQVHV
ncbi:MAG: GGDEF domain-containing protein [Rhodanobacter sp.]